MTWLATGPVVLSMGDRRNESAATAALAGSYLEDQRFPREELRIILSAASRAARRWDGLDPSALPFFDSPTDAGRSGEIAVGAIDSRRSEVFAESPFVVGVIPPNLEEVELVFVDDGQNLAVSAARGLYGGGLPLEDQGDTYVLVDAFIGETTRRTIAMQRVVDGVARVPLRVASKVGALLGTVLRVKGAAHSEMSQDSRWAQRLAEPEEAYAEVASGHPRLGPAAANEQSIVVFIHGTASTCLPALASVSGFQSAPLFRFEHDTMVPIAQNAEDLVAVLESLGSPAVKLVGHSRGGLVAMLVSSIYPKIERVTTFGTPHGGTPLATGVEGLLSYSTLAAAPSLGGILAGGLEAAAFGAGLPRGRLPDGWADMRPESSFIRTLRHLSVADTHAIGGTFDANQPDLGLGPNATSAAAWALFNSENDLVVPLTSSCPAHLSHEAVQQVDHFSYFDPDRLELMVAICEAF